MRSAGKASIPRFAPMPPGVDVAVTASTPPKSFRSRPMWPMASIVGAPCWPLKYMISDAHDTRLPGACPKISWVIRCVRLSANEYGGFRPRMGDCSFQVNDRSNRRALLTARTNSSGDGRVCATTGSAMATVPATPAAAVSHSRRDTAPIGSSLVSGSRTLLPLGVPQIPEAGTGRNRAPSPCLARGASPMLPPRGGRAMAQTASRVTIAPIHPCLGARVEGVDLGEPLDEATFRQIFDAFQVHSVLVFHDQRLTDEAQMAFSRRFGPLESTIKSIGQERRL